MIPQILGTVIRAALASYGGANLMADDEVNQILGALAVLATAAWGIYQKVQAQRAVNKKAA